MKKLLICLLVMNLSIVTPAQNLLPSVWKFQTGDDPEWASPSFDDSEWKDIKAGIQWESQGYNSYDGYAWYRATFNVPADLKEVAEKYNGFNLLLGKIDDVDFTYFNGNLVGSTGKLPPEYETKYNVDRTYVVAAKWINWDGPNTIAVRVFDLYGGGGIYSRPLQFSVRGIADKLIIEPVFKQTDHIFSETAGVSLTVNLINKTRKTIQGKITMKVVSDFGIEEAVYEKDHVLNGRETFPVNFVIPGIKPGFYFVKFTFDGQLAYKTAGFAFGYEPEKISSPVDSLAYFTDFWDDARQELASVEPHYKLTKIDSLCSERRNVYLVEMYSLGDIRLHGWYSVPVKPGLYPAIMQVPGYTGNILPEFVDYGDDIIGFGLNIRGHGNSQDDFNPGFPGYLQYGLQDIETYVYRGAYMDCVRGIDFLYSRPEVDSTRVAVEGGSQGGALTFATAALCNNRIVACAPLVPFLSDFRHYFKVAIWPGNEFKDYVEVEKKLTWDELNTNLSYFDIKNLAGWINCPLFMGVGLVDDICPPHINFAAYNQVKSEKSYIIYPEAGHGLPEDYYDRRMIFFREKLGLEK